MSTTERPAVAHEDHRVPGAFAGTGTMLRFLLRRERFLLPWWLLGATFLFAYQSVGSQSVYDTPQDLANLRETLGANAAVVAMSGPQELLETIGGEVVFEVFAFLSVVVALMNMFLVGRHTRTEEETGRAELIRSARVGRRAPVTAALCLAAIADLALGLLVVLAGIGTGLPAGGSLVLGAAVAVVGLFFAGLAAAAMQVFQGARAAYGSVALALGAAFALRAIGDVGGGAVSWASPIGWGQRTFPYVENRWWPLLFPLAGAALLAAAGFALLDRRDFGAGLVAQREGRPAAPRSLGSPLGLAWRLQRGTLAGWAAGLALLGVGFGSIGDTVTEFVQDNPEVADFLGGRANLIDSYFAFSFVAVALLAAAYGVVSAMRLRAEETSGRAEPILATKVSRLWWLSGHLVVTLAGTLALLVVSGLGMGVAYALAASDPGQIPRLMGASLVHVPAVWLLVGLTVLGLGWLPRAAAAVAWVVFAYCVFIAMFSDAIDLPGWTKAVSPFAHTPELPLESLTATPLAVTAAVLAALLAGGYLGLRRRDLGY
ncbi:exporter of polyketide antibiotics [Actinomadura sp. NBRC 104412]|uniref:ABC transporter permease n=1 Tax=Actinomadura sp. NBRC 104412 TaxID=3032203 RepID=UPI0024A1B85C|nr:ABC transporter permease [Actinomadura sp. NBRC 104412]GLZ05620.1 exporter of polyketide antibiotics [Actinomadura sp. NBRC 104412]